MICIPEIINQHWKNSGYRWSIDVSSLFPEKRKIVGSKSETKNLFISLVVLYEEKNDQPLYYLPESNKLCPLEEWERIYKLLIFK